MISPGSMRKEWEEGKGAGGGVRKREGGGKSGFCSPLMFVSSPSPKRVNWLWLVETSSNGKYNVNLVSREN
jgi:hypothetical protein